METKIRVGNEVLKGRFIDKDVVKVRKFSFKKLRFISKIYCVEGLLKTAEIV